MNGVEEKFERLRITEFARLGDQIYLDHVGSALYTDSHLQKYFNELQNSLLGNPHSGNACSERMHDIVDQVRSSIAAFFNVTSDDYDIVFTSGTTDGLRIIGSYFEWKSESVFAYLEDNHTSVVGIRKLACEKGADSYCLCLDKSNYNDKPSDLTSYTAKLVHSYGDEDGAKFSEEVTAPCLFAYPAQSNFSGAKYPLQWIENIQKGVANFGSFPGLTRKNRKWYVLCDAAAYVSTSPLDLKEYAADFVTISFYKIFGFPTGLGALLVKKESEGVLCNKNYFGGGAVSGWLASHDFHSPKPALHDRLEDGTISFLSILALKHAFNTYKELGLHMSSIQQYTHILWKYFFEKISSLKHANGSPVVEIYTVECGGKDVSNQGPIIAFNIKRLDGSYVGYNHVLQLANSNNIYIRGGCFCNMGACASVLRVSNELLLGVYESGHVCGDSVDIVDGKPIGALRASLGPSSTKKDIETFVEFISSCFREVELNRSLNDILQEKETQGDIVLEEIIVYPVKSCQGMVVDAWEISEMGLKYDRMWMIVDEHGICITLKKNPSLVSIHPSVSLSEKVLVLNAEGMNDIEVSFIFEDLKDSKIYRIDCDRRCTTKVCGDRVEGHDCGEEVSMWLSEVLGKRCYLLQKNFGTHRYAKKSLTSDTGPCEISLVNAAQYLLINRNSVEDLYNRMKAHDGQEGNLDGREIDYMIKRFRGNFVISGAQAFAEDAWDCIHVQSQDGIDESPEKLNFIKCGLCFRCSVICVDPENGRKLNDSLKTLANLTLTDGKTRRKPTFGIYLQCNSTSSTLRVKSILHVAK